MDKNNLANRLLYLPLDIHEKVLLWLTYKELKPVSEITAERRGNIKSLLKKGIRKASTYQFDSPNSLRIRGWIKDAGLVISFEEKYGSAWHISKDKKLANESVESLQKYDYNSEVKSGKLFGFPIESVKTYAKNRGKPYEEIQKSPTYNSGFALRFPRINVLRDDKGLIDVDSLERIKRIYRNQRGQK